MSDPAQQRAAGAALVEASRTESCDPRELTVRQVLRRRRAGSKVPFYYVTLELPTGTRLHFQVSDDGQRVERTSWVPTPEVAAFNRLDA